MGIAGDTCLLLAYDMSNPSPLSTLDGVSDRLLSSFCHSSWIEISSGHLKTNAYM